MTSRKQRQTGQPDPGFFSPRSTSQGKGGGDLSKELEMEDPSPSERRLTALLEGLHKNVDGLDKRMMVFKNKLESLTTRVETTERGLQKVQASVNQMGENAKGMDDLQRDYCEFKPKAISSFLQLDTRLDHLEDRARAAVIRALGIPKNFGGDDLAGAIQQFIAQDILEGASLSQGPVTVLRANRLPTKGPTSGGKRGGTVLVTLGDPSQREAVMKAVIKKGKMEIDGERIWLFPDLCQGTLQRKRSLMSVKKALSARNVQATVIYPAKLRVVNEGKLFVFTQPDAAQAFLDALPPTTLSDSPGSPEG